MFLYYNDRGLVVLLIAFLLLILNEENGFLTKERTTVTANSNTIIPGPFIQIDRPTITRLIITKPRIPHFLSCIATIEETFYYYQNETAYFYTWFRNDKSLDIPAVFPGRRNDFYIFRNGTLRLPPNEKASGVYHCKINANTTAVISESITVEYPVLKRIPAAANVTAANGLSMTFNCPVQSVPPANVTWFYENATLSSSKMLNDNRYLFLGNGSLVIRQSALRDEGKYKCLAQNEFAAKNHRQFMWTLTVETRLNTIKIHTQLIPQLQPPIQYIPQGTELRLLCRGLTDIVPIQWWFQSNINAARLQLTNQSNEFYVNSSNVEQHEGYYTCSTPNDNQTYHVIVTIPPTIVEPMRSYEGLISSSMTLRCETFGNPRPIISWYHNGALFDSSYTRFINGNELLIHSFDPDEDGIYQCFARNVAGEINTAGEIRFKSKGDEMLRENPLHNIRCFAHSFNTINVTFDSKSAGSLFVVHIVQSNPHRWISPFAAMQLNHVSYVVISSLLPVYRPFQLITRVLYPTSEIRLGNKTQQQTMLSSLRSPPVTCCTQGLTLHLVHLGNDTFVTWAQPELDMKKYYILQFSINYTVPHPQQQMLDHELRGTVEHVDLTPEDVALKLTNIEALNRTATLDILKRAESKYIDNNAQTSHFATEEEIFSLIVPSSVTGVLMQHFTRIKLRVLIITKENENLAQDFRYVQWKIIENDTTELVNTPFRLTTVESRMLGFHFQETFNESCVHICHWKMKFPIMHKEEPKCGNRTIINTQLSVRGLQPSTRYTLNMFCCTSHRLYGQLDVKTLPDPPGTISNQRVTRHNGLKLSWDPPLQPNGKIHHYNILWTLGNVTHESNVLECSLCFYKFPNISETAKINVTVRVVGETGVGAPIFIDLRDINHRTLEEERSSSNTEVYSGIAIGSLLSTFCVFFFALLIIFQRRRFKARQQIPTHLTSPSDTNFGNLSNTGIPGDSAGGLSGSTLQQDCHEMQTLIPKSARPIDLLVARDPDAYQTTQLPNGNGNITIRRESDGNPNDLDQTTSMQLCFDDDTNSSNLSQVPLCNSTPIWKTREAAVTQDVKHFFTHFRHAPPPNVVATLQKHSSSDSIVSPPTTLPLVVASFPGAVVSRRNSSLSNSSAGSSSSCSGSSSKKQFHTNFPKHSKSNDGICLLAEEESAATLTPTSEKLMTAEALANGFKVASEDPTRTAYALVNDETSKTTTPTTRSKTSSSANTNNNNSKLKHLTQSYKVKNANVSSQQPNDASIVPAIGPAAAATTSTAAAKHWTTSSTSNNSYRRPNVDPNG